MISRIWICSSLLFCTLLIARPADAHFPWLAINEDGKAVYFFGENHSDRTYKLPASVAAAKINVVNAEGKTEPVEVTAEESDNFVGLVSAQPVEANATLISQVTYGVYHGSRLDYYTAYEGGKMPTDFVAYQGKKTPLALYAQLVDTDAGVDCYVSFQGKPLAGATVQLFCEEGHEEGTAKTDKQGKVSFTDRQVEEGLNAILVGHTVKDSVGEINGQGYKSVAHYLTLTFADPQDAQAKDAKLPKLPEPVTSFGGAIIGDDLYIFGGHKGDAHDYYIEGQSKSLWHLDLNGNSSWKKITTGPSLQGLAMVAHDGKLYRLGGFTAKNNQGEDHDLWSQTSVASFDPATKKWTELPELPEGRSSFDAAVADGKIYVIGGWQMRGEDDSLWHQTAYVLDLNQDKLAWKELPKPPFRKRALSVAAFNGKIYAIGGMKPKGGPTTDVAVLDTNTGQWTTGPALPGEGMDGFGSSAFATGGKLYVSTYSGTLYRLNEDGNKWEKVQDLKNDRFFHRMLPVAEGKLLMVGGASMSSGKFDEVEIIDVK